VRRALVVGLVALAAAAAAAARIGPVERLASYTPDPPGPIYDDPGVDDAVLKRAAALLPRGATYGVTGTPLFDLQGGAPLYFSPALQVPISEADWLLSYHAAPEVPPGLHVFKTETVADGVFLLRIRQR
jgi:hypothetical protein